MSLLKIKNAQKFLSTVAKVFLQPRSMRLTECFTLKTHLRHNYWAMMPARNKILMQRTNKSSCNIVVVGIKHAVIILQVAGRYCSHFYGRTLHVQSRDHKVICDR